MCMCVMSLSALCLDRRTTVQNDLINGCVVEVNDRGPSICLTCA